MPRRRFYNKERDAKNHPLRVALLSDVTKAFHALEADWSLLIKDASSKQTAERLQSFLNEKIKAHTALEARFNGLDDHSDRAKTIRFWLDGMTHKISAYVAFSQLFSPSDVTVMTKDASPALSHKVETMCGQQDTLLAIKSDAKVLEGSINTEKHRIASEKIIEIDDVLPVLSAGTQTEVESLQAQLAQSSEALARLPSDDEHSASHDKNKVVVGIGVVVALVGLTYVVMQKDLSLLSRLSSKEECSTLLGLYNHTLQHCRELPRFAWLNSGLMSKVADNVGAFIRHLPGMGR